MRRWKIPPYCFARLARPRWVSWSIISMLPMMGNPLGPGGYFGFLWTIRDTKPNRSISGRTSIAAIANIGSCLKLLMVCDFRTE